MKAFDISTKFESNTEYVFNGETLKATLDKTVRLEEKIYRAIYSSEKYWLDTAFYLKGLSNVTIDFGGATLLLLDDAIQPFVLDECENVTIKNVTVEYKRCLMDEIDIACIKDGEIWFKQTEKQKLYFPMRVKNGCLIPISDGKEYPDAFKAPHFFNLYDKETKESVAMCLVRIGKDLPVIPKEQFPFKYFELSAEERGEYIVLKGELPPSILSDVTCAQSHSDRDVSSCFIIRSKNTRLENFRVLNGAGMGILGMYSENITLDGLKYFCDEASHGIATNAADALHLISCFGNIEIVNSIFEGMKDDAVNIHCNYYSVESVENGIIHAKIKTDVQAHAAVNAQYKMFDKGDTVAVYRGSTTFEKKTLTVTGISVTGDFTADLFVDGDTSDLSSGDTIENLSIQPNVHIKRSRFGKARTHLRFQTRGKILMEECECSLKILLPGDKNYWYEGSPVNDLTVTNCRFIGDNAFIESYPEFDTCPESPYYHSGIKVIGNTFDSANPLVLRNCKDILFEGNVNSKGFTFANKFSDCSDITEK